MAIGFSDLTPQQQAIFNGFINELRAEGLTLAKLTNRITVMTETYNQQIVPVIVAGGGTFTTSIIPNASGLAGSQDLDWTTGVIALFGVMSFIESSINTNANMSLLVQAAGGLNLMPGGS
jgi:hypothetical protein